MTSPTVIALTGYAGAGKDTVADALVTHAGFRKVAFADALRLEVAGGYRLGDRAHILTNRATKETPTDVLAFCRCHDDAFTERMMALHAREQPDFDWEAWAYTPRSPRQIMQWWGTEYRRALTGPHYWVVELVHRIYRETEAGTCWVITDCRFDNEAGAVRAMGGQIWHVTRPGLRQVEGTHASATDGRRFGADRVLVNGTDVPGLIQTTLRALVSSYGGAFIHIQEEAP